MEILIKQTLQRTIRIGFVPLNDAAPLLLAQELDLFEAYGLEVQLSRELGWASIRDKVATGELTAAQAILGLPLAMFSLNNPNMQQPFVAPLITSLQGNAITIAKHFKDEGCQTPRSIMQWHLGKDVSRQLTFAIVSRYSSHHILMRQWLKSDGIDPDKDVNLVVLPPPQMVHHLKAGHIDGYCVGEPWNSVGIMAGSGFCVATSAEISPYHPEKVFMISRQFAESNTDQSVKLVAAMMEACRLCNEPSSIEMLSRVLARHDYLNLSPDVLQDTLTGNIIHQNNPTLDNSREFIVFSGEKVNVPCSRKRNWIGKHLSEFGVVNLPDSTNTRILNNIYSENLYQAANELTEASAHSPQPSAA